MIGEVVGAAAFVTSQSCKKRLLNNSSILSAETHGILLALDMVHHYTGSQLPFLSDSVMPAKSSISRPLTSLDADILCRVHGLLS